MIGVRLRKGVKTSEMTEARLLPAPLLPRVSASPPPNRFIVTVFGVYALLMTILLSTGISATNHVFSGPGLTVIMSGLAFCIFAGAFAIMLTPPAYGSVRPISRSNIRAACSGAGVWMDLGHPGVGRG